MKNRLYKLFLLLLTSTSIPVFASSSVQSTWSVSNKGITKNFSGLNFKWSDVFDTNQDIEEVEYKITVENKYPSSSEGLYLVLPPIWAPISLQVNGENMVPIEQNFQSKMPVNLYSYRIFNLPKSSQDHFSIFLTAKGLSKFGGFRGENLEIIPASKLSKYKIINFIKNDIHTVFAIISALIALISLALISTIDEGKHAYRHLICGSTAIVFYDILTTGVWSYISNKDLLKNNLYNS